MLKSSREMVGGIALAAVISLSSFQSLPISAAKNNKIEPVVESSLESYLDDSFVMPAISFEQEKKSSLEAMAESAIPKLSRATSIIRAILQYTWCLPQTLSGWLYYTVLKYSGELTESFHYNELIISLTPNMPNSSSMGRFIFLGKRLPQYEDKLVRHEYGHVEQSYFFGPLQIPIVGCTNALWWLFCTNCERNYPEFNFDNYYWNFFTETMANDLVGLRDKMIAMQCRDDQ